MKESDKKVFFARQGKEQITIKNVGGKLSLSSLQKDDRRKVLDMLASKDEVMAKGLNGILPGIKIDGKQVTRDNIHEFEISPKVEKSEVVEKKVEVPKYTKESLMKLSFSKLKKIAEKFSETGRSKSGIIKDILKHN